MKETSQSREAFQRFKAFSTSEMPYTGIHMPSIEITFRPGYLSICQKDFFLFISRDFSIIYFENFPENFLKELPKDFSQISSKISLTLKALRILLKDFLKLSTNQFGIIHKSLHIFPGNIFKNFLETSPQHLYRAITISLKSLWGFSWNHFENFVNISPSIPHKQCQKFCWYPARGLYEILL